MDEIKRYMLTVLEDHRDPLTGEVCATTLAEDTCDALDLWDGDDVLEECFEVAGWIAVVDENGTLDDWVEAQLNGEDF